MLDIKTEVLAAEKRIRNYIRETPLDYSLALSQASGSRVYLKCENLQCTGAFKARGAMSKLLSLIEQGSVSKQGVVTASSGNHGTAVAYGLNKFNLPGKIFVPNYAASIKVDAIRRYNIPVEFYGDDSLVTETHAREYAKQHNMVYLSPYNDPQVIGGQGTIAVELMRQLENIDVVLVPVGGGGLISGIAGYLKSYLPHVKVIGCLPENSPVMAESIKAGRIIEMESKATLSDATAGGIEADAITFELCRKYVDDYILISENEIKAALISLIKTHYMLVEGAAGVAVAALLKQTAQFCDKNVVIVLSGAKVSIETLKDVLN